MDAVDTRWSVDQFNADILWAFVTSRTILLYDLWLVTARVRSTREGNVLTRCLSIHQSVCQQGGYPYPSYCFATFPRMPWGSGGEGSTRNPPRGVYLTWVPPRGGTRFRYPHGYPSGGVPGSGTLTGGYHASGNIVVDAVPGYPPGTISRVILPPPGAVPG